MIVAGLMTGTSADALDIAVTDLRRDDEDLTMRVLAHHEAQFPTELRSSILSILADPESAPLSLVSQVDTMLGRFASDALLEVLNGESLTCDLVVSHGQTVHHWVEDGTAHGTLQIGQPGWIAEATGAPVLSDVRIRDITAGGHGAPLASTLDALLLDGSDEPVAALNLGGIANITVVRPGADPIAYDTGAANALIDLAVRHTTGDPTGVDQDGRLAASGSVDAALLDELVADPYYSLPAPKSTGKEYFSTAYLDRVLARHPDIRPRDLVATLTELTARTVARECHRHGVTAVWASGGGTRNPELMRRLRVSLGPDIALATTDDLGLPHGIKEAALMSLIGWFTWHGLPFTIPSCTGARHRTIAGRLTAGAAPLALPAPHAVQPTRLRIVA